MNPAPLLVLATAGLALAQLVPAFGAPSARFEAPLADPLDGLHPSSSAPTQKITTFLWFDDDAEEAIRFYSSIFADSRVLDETRFGEGEAFPAGTLRTARFQLAGQEFMALNGGPMYKFTEAISLCVTCETQAEVDELWTKLTAGGGAPGQCGWLEDSFGLSWQVVPRCMGEMLQDEDAARVRRVAEALMQMTKIDIQRLQQTYEQR